MQINNYQSNQNPNFSARFINNVKTLDIDTKKVGALFEKLTKVSLDKPYSWGEIGDIFTLRDNRNNILAKIACSFTTHSEIDENPEKQASLLNNIFRFMKERARENTALKEINDKINNLRERINNLVRQKENLRKEQDQNILQDAKKYSMEISELEADDPHFRKIYKTAQFMLKD